MSKPAFARSSELRQHAWEAMSMTWQTVLSILFVINIISTIGSLVAQYIPLFGWALSMAVSFALTVPRMGLTRGALDHLNGRFFTYEHISSMTPYIRQVLCFHLWEMLFLLLWGLPGGVLTVVGLAGVFSTADSTIVIVSFVLAAAGFLLMVVLQGLAMLNYTLASCCIADTPNMGGRQALARSKELMRGHRWRYILMMLPVWGITLVIGVIGTLLGRAMDPMLTSLLITILSIVPDVMTLYMAPVLYTELAGSRRLVSNFWRKR